MKNLYSSLTQAWCKGIFGIRHNLPWPGPTFIFEREWDLLIVLDGCRFDIINELVTDYEYHLATQSVWSPASESTEWLRQQFQPKYRRDISQTAYITGNPYSKKYLSQSEFGLLDQVWQRAWNNEVSGMPPRPITDSAIATGRHQSYNRVIAHYMQPHFPSFPEPLDSGTPLKSWGEEWDSVWTQLEKGDINRKEVWDSYRKNLNYILTELETLLSNYNAEKAIITADHGNAFGECGIYGHPQNYPLKTLRKVPWIKIAAKDTKSYIPDPITRESSPSTQLVDQRLRDLGYK